MMSYDKYDEEVTVSYQRITYKKMVTLILWLTQSNQWVEVDHTTRIHSLNSSSITSSVEKNKITIMTKEK